MISSGLYQEALINGDARLIGEIYEKCFPQVKGFVIRNNGTEQDAEDIFQKSLLQIAVRYRKEKFEIRGDFDGYLFTVCKNLWRRELNKSKSRVTNDTLLNLYSEEQDNALALMEQKRFELFNEKLNLISENCRKVLSLYFAKVSYAEIVKAIGYNSETVARQRVFKCKKSLTDLVKNDKRFFLAEGIMSLEEDYLIERFLKGELSGEEDQRFRERLASDMEFQEKVSLEQQLFDTFNEEGWSRVEKPDHPEVAAYTELFDADEAKAMKAAIASSASTYKNGAAKNRIRPLWLYASAAAVLLVLSFYFLFSGSSTPEELYTTYLDRTELPSMVTRADEAAEQIKGQAYFENKEFAAAEKAFADLIRQGGQNASFYIYLSLAQAELMKFGEALTTLDSLIASDLLDSEKGYWYKSLVYLKADDVVACEKLLSVIVENRYYNYRLAEELIKELR